MVTKICFALKSALLFLLMFHNGLLDRKKASHTFLLHYGLRSNWDHENYQ